MEFKVYQHSLSTLYRRFNLMVALVVVLLVSNALLSGLSVYLAFHQRVIVTPFFGQSHFVASDSTVDKAYLALMCENFMYARLNVTPETVKDNHERLLTFVNSQHYGRFQEQLGKESNLIMEDNISSHFDITRLSCDAKSLQCRVTGLLKRTVGLRELAAENMQYLLQFRYHLGRLTVVQFTRGENT